MTDDNKIQAVDQLAEALKMLIRGWPIYSMVIAILWGYGDLWLDKRITQAIETKTLTLPLVVEFTGNIEGNTKAIVRIEDKVEEVEGDTKAILRHLAGQ